jgi:Tfp pilus assembly protein PilN
VIKVNLATKKRMNIGTVDAPGGGGPFGLGALGGGGTSLSAQFDDLKRKLRLDGLRFDAGLLRESKVKQLLGGVVVAVAVTWIVSGLKQDEIREVDNQIAAAAASKATLEVEAAKYKNFELQKKQLDEDEMTISTKLRTIQALIVDRQTTPKFLIALSSEIPPTAWLTDFSFNSTDMTLKGYAMGYAQISDFMKALGDNVYLQDVKLVSTSRARDVKEYPGVAVAAFELAAKRRAAQ